MVFIDEKIGGSSNFIEACGSKPKILCVTIISASNLPHFCGFSAVLAISADVHSQYNSFKGKIIVHDYEAWVPTRKLNFKMCIFEKILQPPTRALPWTPFKILGFSILLLEELNN